MNVRLTNAGMRFGDHWVFRNLNFAVQAGRSLAILGPNGRGKTTALHALLGFHALTEGERTCPKVIGYVPQLLAVHGSYSTREIVVMGRSSRLGLFGQPKLDDYRAADSAMERVAITHLAKTSFDRLSGGERQMALLARALATGSSVLVLDEPCSALDLKNEGRLLRLLDELRSARTMTIVFTTHDPNHALMAADDALLMMGESSALSGPVYSTLNEKTLSDLYDVRMRQISLQSAPGQTVGLVVPLHAHMKGLER